MTAPEELLASIAVAEIIGTVTDAMGDLVKVGVLGHAVLIGVIGSPAVLDTPELRDDFAKLYAEACRRAEAAEAKTAAEAEVAGLLDGIVGESSPLPDMCAYHGGEGDGGVFCDECREDQAAAAVKRAGR